MNEFNPYQAPAAPLNDVEEGPARGPSANVVGDVTEEELRGFVGSSAERYLRTWRPALKANGRAWILGIHPGGFFLPGLWLPYRKMYRETVLFYVFLTAAAFADYEMPRLFPGFFREGRIFWPVILAIPFVCGLWAYSGYLNSSRRKVLAIRAASLGLPDDTYAARLTRRGGISLIGPPATVAIYIIAMIIFAFIFDSIFS